MQKNNIMKEIAIVIPAYKAQFFRHTLESLAHQSCKNFTLYIGDDASPDDFESLVSIYKKDIDIVYKKFDNNLGGKDLVAQWKRCIEMTKGEPWIWLFSDDDILGPNCIRLLLDELTKQSQKDIYHFNVSVIDEYNNVVRKVKRFPTIISSKELFIKKESATIESFVVEYIFSRDIYDKVGGFQEFDLAWGSDITTWVKMGNDRGIKTIEGDEVFWRSSSLNITTNLNKSMVYRKFRASLDYMVFVNDFFKDADIISFNLKNFYRLLFHYSNILDIDQLKFIIKMAFEKNIISHRMGALMSKTLHLTIFLKRIKVLLIK